jgi:hypothetical protein
VALCSGDEFSPLASYANDRPIPKVIEADRQRPDFRGESIRNNQLRWEFWSNACDL